MQVKVTVRDLVLGSGWAVQLDPRTVLFWPRLLLWHPRPRLPQFRSPQIIMEVVVDVARLTLRLVITLLVLFAGRQRITAVGPVASIGFPVARLADVLHNGSLVQVMMTVVVQLRVQVMVHALLMDGTILQSQQRPQYHLPQQQHLCQ